MEGLSASVLLHAYDLFGTNYAFVSHQAAVPNSANLFEALNDSSNAKSLFSFPLFVTTRYGLRPAPSPAYENSQEQHADQTLAYMAKWGLPITTELYIDGEKYTIGELLADSYASFELKQGELEWSAIAYAGYLNRNQTVLNKFGQSASLDDIAHELLRRRLSRQSCAGLHLFEAISCLYSASKNDHVAVSKEVQDRLRERLIQMCGAAELHQSPDGSWGVDWFSKDVPAEISGGAYPASSAGQVRLLATSHLASCFLFLHEDIPVSDACLARSASWLHRALLESTADPNFVVDNYCPCSHALFVLEQCPLDISK